MLLSQKWFDQDGVGGGEAAASPETTLQQDIAAASASIPSPAPQADVGGAPAPASPGATPAASGGVDVFSIARDVGYDLSKYRSPEEAIRGILEAQRFVGRRSQEADIGRAVRQNPDLWARVAPVLTGQPQPEPVPQQQQQAPQGPGIPSYSQEQIQVWQQLCDFDPASNSYVPKQTYMFHPAAQQAAQALTSTHQWNQQLAVNPQAAMMQFLQPFAEATRQHIAQQQQEFYQQQQYNQERQQVAQFVSQWAVERGPNGQVLHDPITNGVVPTEIGRQYAAALAEVQQMMPQASPMQQHDWAMTRSGLAFELQQMQAQAERQQQQSPQQPRQQQPAATRNGAAGRPRRAVNPEAIHTAPSQASTSGDEEAVNTRPGVRGELRRFVNSELGIPNQ